MDTQCDAERLGCTEGNTIYILQFTDEAEYNRAIVTTAHEMLHVAYSRLSDKEVQSMEAQLKAELAGYSAAGIADKLADYAKEDYYNEAHSFIGSELDDISPGFAQHYAQYFADRTKTTAAYHKSPER
jgi:hypothetical protein